MFSGRWGAQIDTATDHVSFSKLNIRMPPSLSEKKLYLMDFCELVRLGKMKGSQVKVMTCMVTAQSCPVKMHRPLNQKCSEIQIRTT